MLNEKTIEMLEKMGAKRWIKGDMDRMYVNYWDLGFEITKRKTGSVSDAKLGDRQLSNSDGARVIYAKAYIDVKTGEVNETCDIMIEPLKAFLDKAVEAEKEEEKEETEKEEAEEKETKEENKAEKAIEIRNAIKEAASWECGKTPVMDQLAKSIKKVIDDVDDDEVIRLFGALDLEISRDRMMLTITAHRVYERVRTRLGEKDAIETATKIFDDVKKELGK